jgi:hypothetical protein
MPKALISSFELMEHIPHFIGMNPSKVVMSKDRISFIRGKQNLYTIQCQTDNLRNQTVETKYIYDKWEIALNYLCSISETPIFLELLPKGSIKLTSAIILK